MEPIKTAPLQLEPNLISISLSVSIEGKSPQTFFEVLLSVGANVAWQ